MQACVSASAGQVRRERTRLLAGGLNTRAMNSIAAGTTMPPVVTFRGVPSSVSAGVAAVVLRIGSSRAFSGARGSYHQALEALQEDTREWWQDVLTGKIEADAGEEPYGADAESLARFLRERVGGWYKLRRVELEQRPHIRAQAFGEALEPKHLERLARYEVHLDRKFERMFG